MKALIGTIMLAMLIAACQNGSYADEKLTITTTVFPMHEIASRVAGDNANVILLLPEGADPHHFDPRPSDILAIQKSDIFIYIGEALEPWAHDILESLDTNAIIIEAADYAMLIEGHEDEEESDHDDDYDPHIWLDFNNNIIIAERIAEALSSIDPNNAAQYVRNAQEYGNSMSALDLRYRNELSSCDKDVFISGGHNVFGYLEHKYDIHAIPAIPNLEPSTEPTPRAIAELIRVARENEVRYILTEVLVSQRMADAIAREVGAQVLLFNPGHSATAENKAFIDIMEDNLEVLKIALECN
jgi:zinc transport system substrate-binding protein